MMKYEKPDLYNADCMEAMREFPDKYFDLAIVDPPYGNANDEVFRTGGTWADKYGTKIKAWDTIRHKNPLNCLNI